MQNAKCRIGEGQTVTVYNGLSRRITVYNGPEFRARGVNWPRPGGIAALNPRLMAGIPAGMADWAWTDLCIREIL